ncbi:MAG: GntP family permease [Candidatus Marisimplicoccus sp.]
MIISIITFIGLFYFSYRFKIKPFLTILFASFLSGFFLNISILETLYLIYKGFYSIVIVIGPIIIIGTLLGKFLNETGTSRKMVNTFISYLGINNIPISLNIIGFIISIPVFCDAAFILMSSIVKDLSRITKKNIILLSICLATGLYSAHVFVPPTPGPIAASAIMEADIGLLFLIGIIVGAIVSIAGYVWIKFLFKKEFEINAEEIQSYQFISNRSIISFLPIVLPILLISSSTIINFLDLEINQFQFLKIFVLIGKPEISLLVGFITTLIFLRKDKVNDTPLWVVKSLKDSFEILLITGSGGALGYIIRESGIINSLSINDVKGLASILSVFIIAAIIKTIQGSSTVAIVTTCAITAPLIQSIGMTSELKKVILIVSIGSGAMTISHINDSYFWVVSKYSNIEMNDVLKFFSTTTLIQGLFGLLTSISLYIFLT